MRICHVGLYEASLSSRQLWVEADTSNLISLRASLRHCMLSLTDHDFLCTSDPPRDATMPLLMISLIILNINLQFTELEWPGALGHENTQWNISQYIHRAMQSILFSCDGCTTTSIHIDNNNYITLSAWMQAQINSISIVLYTWMCTCSATTSQYLGIFISKFGYLVVDWWSTIIILLSPEHMHRVLKISQHWIPDHILATLKLLHISIA